MNWKDQLERARAWVSLTLDRVRALMPWRMLETISVLKQQRDEARMMLTLLAAEVVNSKRRPSKKVERLLEKFLPTAREW